MSLISTFAGTYSALDYAFGTAQSVAPSGLQVVTGNTAVGVGTITIATPITTTQGGTPFSPIAIGSVLTIGNAANAETVTVTGVGIPSLAGFAPDTGSITVTATFANLHGPQENVLSATYGLQEAINVASQAGGGSVAVYPAWYKAGGTAAMVAAATVPTSLVNTSAGYSGVVRIVDAQTLQSYTYGPRSVTVVAAPSAATSATVASTTAAGTWTAITIHVLFTYVTPDGGESLASSDYSFTATVSEAIGGTGPAASTGAVGYRVYMGANATTTCYLSPVTAANGTPIQCGPIAAFKIGTSFSVATANVAAALIPVQSSAFPAGFQPATAGLLGGNIVEGPFAVTGVVTAGTAIEGAIFQLPAAYLNRVNKAFRLTVQGIFTPVSTATLIVSVAVGSVYNGTETTIYTTTSAATTGTTASDFLLQVILRTALIGATGTVEAHGFTIGASTTATANIAAVNIDNAQAASSAVDLTGQGYIRVLINSGTANLTQSQIRTVLLEPLN
jgi:hypothetical protein